MAVYFVFSDELIAGLETFDIVAPLYGADGYQDQPPAAGDEVILCRRGAVKNIKFRLRIESVEPLDERHFGVRLEFPKRQPE